MKSIARCGAVCALAGTLACSDIPGNSGTPNDTPVTADHTFTSGRKARLDLGGGSYQIRTAAGDHIHVVTSGHTGDAKVDIATEGPSATVTVSNTPRSNFHAAIDVPKTTDLVIRLAAGDLDVAPIGGDLDVDSNAGNVIISVSDPNDYAKVDASAKAGDIKAGPFGESKSGLMPHLTWSGPGKHVVTARLGAGNL